jgi:hypothetical protein
VVLWQSTDGHGNGVDEFDCPRGFAVSATGDLFVDAVVPNSPCHVVSMSGNRGAPCNMYGALTPFVFSSFSSPESSDPCPSLSPSLSLSDCYHCDSFLFPSCRVPVHACVICVCMSRLQTGRNRWSCSSVTVSQRTHSQGDHAASLSNNEDSLMVARIMARGPKSSGAFGRAIFS